MISVREKCESEILILLSIPLLLLLPDHHTKLPVVQLVIPTGVKLGEGHLHLLVRQVGADGIELLKLNK